MSKKVRSDATGMDFMDTSPSKLAQEIQDEVREAMEEANKATAFVRDQNMPRNVAPPAPRNISHNSTGPRTTNQFNIVGGTIGQAAIGNEGPVTFNKEQKIFERGSSNAQYKISGGNFSQANIGGSSVYNNKGSTINAGGGGAAISAEEMIVHILENGVSTEDFMKLLERRYTLANIAFAVPKDPALRGRMVQALLME